MSFGLIESLMSREMWSAFFPGFSFWRTNYCTLFCFTQLWRLTFQYIYINKKIVHIHFFSLYQIQKAGLKTVAKWWPLRHYFHTHFHKNCFISWNINREADTYRKDCLNKSVLSILYIHAQHENCLLGKLSWQISE